ncbi:MAG: DUF2339 domain-containing protein [Candidatus Marsarchaeota archaeon]|nr:DUF2339 domain-containing protein [Candidatus Marsarchaeota archaeon]
MREKSGDRRVEITNTAVGSGKKRTMFSFVPLAVLLILALAAAGVIALILAIQCRNELRSATHQISDLTSRLTAIEKTLARLRRKPADAVQRETAPVGVRVQEPPSTEPPSVTKPPASVPVTETPKPRIPATTVKTAESPQPPSGGLPWMREESFEAIVGKRWMTWAGVAVLFLSAGFFIKYAFENQWLGPTGRVVLGIVAGLGLLIAGDHFLRKELRALGQGLVGGGLATLYLSLFAAFSFYQLITQIPAFGFMVLVTGAGVALAVLHDALPLSILAVLGGFVTPLMVSTGQDPRDALFAYVYLLDAGVLAVAFFKRWTALDLLAWAGTWLLFAGWYGKFYIHGPATILPTMVWITAFFTLFLILPFVYQLRFRTAETWEFFVLALGNAVVTFAFSYWTLHGEYAFLRGFAALALAASYLVLGVLCRKRIPDDARSLFGFVALSTVFLTLAAPLQLRLHGISLAWAVEGPILLYLGYRFDYFPVRVAGFIVLTLAAARLFVSHWPLHTGLYVPIFNRSFGSAIAVPAALAVFGAIHHYWKDHGVSVDGHLKVAAGVASGFLTLMLLHVELGGWLQIKAPQFQLYPLYLAWPALAILWSLGATGFLAAGLRTDTAASWIAGLVALCLALILVLGSYGFNKRSDYILFLNFRFLASLLVVACVVGHAWIVHRFRALEGYNWDTVAMVLIAACGIVPLVALSLETYVYCENTIRDFLKARWMAQMSLSVVWAIYAVIALCIGFWRRIRPLRLAALGLLGITAVKLLLIDMSQVQQIYRIVSFLVLGAMMIGASYLYHRLERQLAGGSR